MPTSISHQEPIPDALANEAVDLVLRLTSGEATTADERMLREWRGRDRFHEQAFREAARLWRGLRSAAEALPDA